MKRRSGAVGKSAKPRVPKRSTPKGGNAPKAERNRGASIISQETVVARLTHERDEALLRETANSEILRLISKSPGDLELVFRAVLENATRICDANFGILSRFDGENFYTVAQFNAPAALREALTRRGVYKPTPGSAFDHIMRTKNVFHSADNTAEPVPGFATKFGAARSLVAVPMLKDKSLIGGLVIYRQEVLPFTDKQIALVQNFANQAAIAIENTRLLNELRERTQELTEALEQRTATSEVLGVISSTPGELTSVFETILANALRLCDADMGHVLRAEAGVLSVAALRGERPEYGVFLRERGPWRPGPHGAPVQAMEQKKPIQIADMRQTSGYTRREPATVAAVELGDIRTALFVPMVADEKAIGVIAIYRRVVRLFVDRQIALVQNFAAQAVIAIENARLLNELRQRTTDLGEALEQQTATADVLRVISRSPGELQPVFEAMLQNAVRICDAKFGNLALFENDGFRHVAQYGAPPKYRDARQRQPFIRGKARGNLDRVMKTKQVDRVADVAVEQPDGDLATLAGARTLVTVPMLKDNELVGTIAIYRQEVRPFTDKQIELLKNFAAQAVIAIENTRLLNELREKTDEVVKLNQQLERRVADQVGEIERMGRLRRFLPPQVADLIVASGTEKQLESHRREITALFCDLRGFTGFSESSDPEDVMALLAEYHAAIGTIINKYSGTLERYAGDGVMVIFNDPVPVENPALQAVLMALDMRAAIGGLIEKWRELGHDLGFGIGIAHGFATLGTIGFEGRRDYAAIGTVSNVASRLCDEAKPGQILISPRIRQAIEKAVMVEAVGEFVLKGIRRPMAAYNVLASSSSKPN